MTKYKAEKNKISSSGLFYIIFVSRAVVCLTSVHSVSESEMKTDTAISYIISLLFTVLLSLPAVICVKKGKNPLDFNWLCALYFIWFSYSAAAGISRFSYFASTTLSPETKGWVFALVVTLCALYGASLGIEALSRFSSLCCALLFIAVLSVIFCNIKNYNDINLYPVVTSSKSELIKNMFIYSSNTGEISLLLCLFSRVNQSERKTTRAFIRGIAAAHGCVFALMVTMLGVEGDAAAVRNFPFYSLFQVSKFVSFERLDALHISFWITGIFLKSAVFIYCAADVRKGAGFKKSAAAAGGLSFIIACFLLGITAYDNITVQINFALFLIFSVIIPAFTAVFYRKKRGGDELVKLF